MSTARVVVVGGGITGLTVAHGLVRRGLHVSVLEAAPVLGGVIQTIERDGFLLEQGPFSVLVRSAAFGEMLAELGLAPIEVDADAGKKRFVLRDGALRLVPTSPGSLLTTPLLSLGGRVRVLRGVFRSPPRPAGADETMHQVARRRLGHEAADYLAGAAAVGIFGAEADELSFDACVPAYARADREGGSIVGMLKSVKRAREAAGEPKPPRRAMISFDGGLAALIDALTAGVGAGVHTAARVSAIRRDGDRFIVTHQRGDLEADAVVLAATPDVCRDLAAPIAPGVAEPLSQIRSTGLGVVHLGFRRDDVSHPLDGFGFLLPKTERLRPLLGTIWASSVFPQHAPSDHVLVRAIIGGTRWPDALHAPDEELISQSFAALKPILGLKADPVLAQARAWPDCVPVYQPGHTQRVARVHDAAAETAGLWCAGNWTGGLGVNDRVAAGRALAATIADHFGVRSTSPANVEAPA